VDVLKGYELARNKVVEYLTPLSTWSCTDVRSVEQLTKCVKTAISSKQLGMEADIASLVAQAAVKVMPPVASNFSALSTQLG
jgi:T-complex protein 1 subunit theta